MGAVYEPFTTTPYRQDYVGFHKDYAVMHFLHHRILGLHLCVRLRLLRFEPDCVQTGRNLSLKASST
jgi:hypothetical protein